MSDTKARRLCADHSRSVAGLQHKGADNNTASPMTLPRSWATKDDPFWCCLVARAPISTLTYMGTVFVALSAIRRGGSRYWACKALVFGCLATAST